jgi:hypothetical protein
MAIIDTRACRYKDLIGKDHINSGKIASESFTTPSQKWDKEMIEQPSKEREVLQWCRLPFGSRGRVRTFFVLTAKRS